MHKSDRTKNLTASAMLLGVMLCGASTSKAAPAGDSNAPILPLPGPIVATTVPANGDQNPYGVAFAGPNFPSGGLLNPGDILVSNFNNSVALGNLQGTGTTIVKINPAGQTSLFFQGQSGLGLSTALGVLNAGIVVVGNFPTTNGNCSTATSGSLIFLD